MRPDTASTRAATPGAPGALADMGTALVRVWQSIQLYGVGHARCREAAEACAAAFGDFARGGGSPAIQFTPDSIVLREGDRSESVGAPGLAEACALLNIVQVEALRTPTTDDLVGLLTAVLEAAKERRRRVSHEFGSQDVGAFRVTVLSLAGMSVGDSPGGDHGGVAWEDLAQMMLHPDAGDGASRASELLERLVPRAGGQASGGAQHLAQTVRRLKRSEAADRQGAIARLRSTLARVSPELRAELSRVRGPDALAAIEDLADVLPVGETCETLAELDERQCHLSDASIRLVRRLAGMASGTPADLGRVASLAESWSARTPAGSPERGSFSALADLCREATRADFIPAEYEARLNEIAAGTIGAAPRAEHLLAQDETDDEVHAGEVLLALAEDPDQADGSVLERLAATAPAFADAGRPDLLLRARAHTTGRAGVSDGGPETPGDEEGEGPAASELLARAIARCDSDASMGEAERRLAGLPADTLAPLLAGVLAGHPTPEARGFAFGLLRRSLADRDAVLLERLAHHAPALLAECVELVAELDPERAFGVIRTALASSAGKADREVFLAADAIPHRWPDPLTVRGLIASDQQIRLAAVRRAASSAPDAITLVCQRLVGSLSDAPLDAAERAEWIRVLAGVTPRTGARSPLSLALRYAAWRPTRAAALAGRDLWLAIRRGRVGLGDRLVWAVAPARVRGCLPGARGRGGGRVRQQLERALTAMNAAWSGEQIYGADHPVVETHVRDAAEAFGCAAERCSPATAFFLPDRVTIADRVIEAGPTLLAGLFSGMGDRCPDCLQVTPGTKPEHVRRLARAIADGGTARTGAIIGPLALRWAHVGSASSGKEQATPIAGAMARDLERAWAAAGQGAPGDQLEHLAGEIASAIANDSATLMPLAGLKRHDEYTFVHAINVGLMSSALCEAVGLSPERTRQVTLGAMLHDVGKQAMPADIINKPGKLSDAERAVLNAHPAAGARLLAASADLPPVVLTIAYEHHMNLDGTGYPRRPPCLRIALPSQIVHIADVFDALRTHRPYREALPVDRALAIMGEEAGRCYDADLFGVFCDRVVRRFTRGHEAAPRSEAA